MGFVIGSSSLSHSPLYIPHFPSSYNSHSQSVFFCIRNVDTKRKNRAPMASLRHEDHQNDSVSSNRRAFLFLGFSLLPLLQLRARALEGLITKRKRKNARSHSSWTQSKEEALESTKETEQETSEESQKAEQALQRDSSPNPFLSFLNGLGIFGGGVLGALYALGQKEKKATEATIESMKTKVKEKEAAIVSLEKFFEAKLLNEHEERTKLLKKAKEEQQSLLNRINLANSTITGLGQELRNEKRLIEELKVQIDGLQTNLSKVGEDKKALEEKLKEKLDSIEVLQERINLLSIELKDKEDNVQNLSSSLAEKESQLENLNSTCKKTKDELAKAHLEIKGLKDELLSNQKELELKNSVVDELNERVSSLMAERDDSSRKFDAIQEELNDLKLSSEKKAALDAKLLGEREHELDQLKEKIELALNEVSSNQAVIADLTQEKEDLRKMLAVELSNVKDLKHELQITQETLGKSRNEASDLGEQLKQSKNLCVELEAEVSRVQAEFAEARETLQRSFNEAKRSGEVLASELTTAKELLKKTSEELQIVSHELAATAENRDSLQKELVDVYKKAETTANDLKEEKKVVSSLNKELQALEKQILNDKKARKSLETDLEEATKSLDEMNQNALALSRDLEMANSRISSLEDENEVLYKSITEQKNASKEARDNMEDAHNLVMRLGKEREHLHKRAKRLEEALASAKGEILRLRSEINSPKVMVNDQHQEKDEAESKVTVSAKRTGRRRKPGSQ